MGKGQVFLFFQKVYTEVVVKKDCTQYTGYYKNAYYLASTYSTWTFFLRKL